MLKISAIATASAAAVLIATAPAIAGETFTMSRMMVADLGHDVNAMARLASTDAKLLSARSPEVPSFEKFYFSGGQAVIAIHLDARGAVTTATVRATTGFARIDRNALNAVRNATYQPATVDGSPVGGDYVVNVNFDPQSE